MCRKLSLALLLLLLALSSLATANTGDLLVSGRFSNSIVEYNGTTGAFQRVFASGGALNDPVGMVYGPDGNLYVGNGNSNNVLWFNGVTGAPLGVFATGGGLSGTRDLTFGPDGNLYVASGGSASIIRYNGTTGAFMNVFASGGGLNGPVGLTFGPDQNLYVSSSLTNQVLRYNGTTGAFMNVFASGGGLNNPTDVVFRPDGHLYVLSGLSNQVLRYDATTGAFTDVFAQGGRLNVGIGLLFRSNGNLLVGSNQTNSVLEYDGANGAFLDVFASGGGLNGSNGLVTEPPPVFVKSITVSPTTGVGGSPMTGTITLNNPAPTGGITVNLTSSDPALAVPSTATVLAGATTGTFPITVTNNTYAVINVTLIESLVGEPNHTVVVPVYPANRAQFVSQTVPSAMTAGQHYVVSLQYKNTGLTTWDTAHGYKLQSRNATNNTTWGANRILLSNSPVAPGATGIFTYNAVAPLTAGTYNFQWLPIEDSIPAGFGPTSTNVAVVVTKAVDAAQFVSNTGATTVFAGADFFSTNTMKNVGTSTWTTAAFYSMMSVNPNNNVTWGGNRIPIPGSVPSVAPGASVTFSKLCTAPITPGTYTMQWQVDRGGTPFGDKTPLINMVVVAGSDNAQYISSTAFSKSVAPSTAFPVTFTMKNLGTATWSAANYSFVSIGSNFGVASISAGSVAPNANGTFSGSFTAPATPGTYSFQYRMQHTTTKFGQPTPLFSIVVSADAAQYISRAGAITVNAGADFFPQYTMKNTGTTTWTQASGYSLIAQTPLSNTVWGPNRLLVPSAATVTPGTSVVCTNLCTAPIVPGTYSMQWQMAKASVPFGELTPAQTMTVVNGVDNASFVSNVGVPTSIVVGKTFNATVTMKNIGTDTWGTGTHSLVSIGSNNFGVASIASGSVAPNANGAFTATFTAPATPGTYTFRYRMQNGTTKFGQSSTPVTITVTLAPGLYVSSFNSGDVIEYDSATGAYVRTITSGVIGPYGICFGSDGILYLGTLNTPKKIWRYNASTGAILGQFADMGGADRSDIRFGADGSLYAVREGTAGGVMKFIASTGQNLGNFTPAIVDPIAMAFGPSGDLFVDSFSTNQVLRFNGTTGASMGVFASTGLNQPYGMCFGPDGNLYVANIGTNSISRYNGTTGAFLGTFASGGGLSDPTGILFAPDGNLLVSSALTNQILRYNGTTGAFMNVFSSGGGLNGPTFMTLGPRT